MPDNTPNVVVSFPARNEEDNLPEVLDALQEQSLKPVKVIIANDGSTDKTEEIASSYSFTLVVNREKREGTLVGKKEMAKVWNDSIKPAEKIHEDQKLDFIVFLGGDLVLSKTYIEDLATKFEENNNLMIASGSMAGEFAHKYSGFMVPGGGRMTRYNYWLELGGEYPYKQGWEAYPIYKANVDGYETKVFDDIKYYPLRPTGGRTDYNAYGQAMKALGYWWLFALGRMFKQPFMQGRSIKSAWNMFLGYFFSDPELYGKEIRQFVNSSQKRRIRDKLPF